MKTKYDVVSGTRRVVLENFDNGFYGNDKFREHYHNWFKDKLQKGEEVYYEVVGYVNETTPIMPDGDNKKVQDKEFTKKYGDKTRFSYGCAEGFNNIYVYRMTMTNEDGYVVEYPWELVKTRCEEMGVNHVPELDRFLYTTEENLLKKVNKYLDIPDPIGKTHIAEGVVVRIDNKKSFKAYKKKGFFFKVLERNNKRYGRSARYGGSARMRDTRRIKPFLERLEKMWNEVPDWRFGQLMCNVLNSMSTDPFFVEDEEMIEYFEEFFKEEK